jgi:hypothetical protein
MRTLIIMSLLAMLFTSCFSRRITTERAARGARCGQHL